MVDRQVVVFDTVVFEKYFSDLVASELESDLLSVIPGAAMMGPSHAA